MSARLGSLGADRDALIGAVTVAAVTLFVILGMTGAITALFDGGETRTVRALFADTQQLRVGDGVRIDGVKAGEVTDTELSPDRRSSLVTMKVEEQAGPIYADAGAILRFQTVLGGKFYVDIERGSAARGRLAGTIPVARTARQVEIDDIARVIRGDSARGLQTMPGELATALADEDLPARLLDTVGDVAPAVRRGVGALRGRDVDRDLRGLVADTARTVRALDAPDEQLRTVVTGAAATVSATASRSRAIRSSLRTTPVTLAEIRRTTRRLDRTLGIADPLLTRLQEPARAVAPAFRTLRPVLVDANGLARRAEPLLDALRPGVRSLAGAARRGLPLVEELLPSLDRVDQTILPYLAEKDPGTGKSTAVMIGGSFAGLAAGAGGQMDANGHFIRFPASVGNAPLNSLPCQLYINNPDSAQIAACNDLTEAVSTFFSYKPLAPTPGTADDPDPGGGG